VPLVTVIVPTFNEGGNVPELVRRLAETFEGRSAEVFFVDDSSDGTADVIARVARGSPVLVRLLHRETPAGGLGRVSELMR